jgi:hypothetical protein
MLLDASEDGLLGDADARLEPHRDANPAHSDTADDAAVNSDSGDASELSDAIAPIGDAGTKVADTAETDLGTLADGVETANDASDAPDTADSAQDEPPSPKYLAALEHFPDLPQPKKGTKSWQPQASEIQPDLCPQWEANGWKALDVNPCDTPVATAQAQAELALVPNQCQSAPWKALNVVSMVDIEAELEVLELDYSYAYGGIIQIWPTGAASVGMFSRGPGNHFSPVKSTYTRVRHYDSNSILSLDAKFSDGVHYVGGGRLKVFDAGEFFFPARTLMDYESKVSKEGYPDSLGWLLPYFVYRSNIYTSEFPEAVSMIGPMGGLWDIRETSDGFLLAAEANPIEVEGNPCVDVTLRRVTIDGGLQWTRYFGQYPANPNYLGLVTTAAKSVRAVALEGCGYAISLVNAFPAQVPYLGDITGGIPYTPQLITTYYVTESGHVVHRSDYHIGKWYWNNPSYNQKMASDGQETWYSWHIGEIQVDVPNSGGGTSVLRLGPNGKPKAFTVLSGFGSVPNAMLALPTKAVVMSIGYDGAIVVLGPDLCPILKYDGFVDLVAGGVIEIVRVNDTLFAAHDKYRLYFFELPELFEWEQSQATPNP